MYRPMQNPGSAEAIGRGCKCDFVKNDFGRGRAEPDGLAFYCSEVCPVHGVLVTITSPKTDVGFLSDETKAALKWLKARVIRPHKRPSDN